MNAGATIGNPQRIRAVLLSAVLPACSLSSGPPSESDVRSIVAPSVSIVSIDAEPAPRGRCLSDPGKVSYAVVVLEVITVAQCEKRGLNIAGMPCKEKTIRQTFCLQKQSGRWVQTGWGSY